MDSQIKDDENQFTGSFLHKILLSHWLGYKHIKKELKLSHLQNQKYGELPVHVFKYFFI